MKIALVQFDIAWEDPAANFATVGDLLQRASRDGALSGSLILLPEMFANGFSTHGDKIKESFGGATESFLADMAEAYHATVGGGWVLENPGAQPLNVFSIIDESGDVLCRYAKLHPFSFAEEDQHYAAGEGIFSCRVGETVVTPFICYDLRFPEVFRIPAPETQLFVVPANWPSTRIEHFDALLKARAIENQAFVAGVNRVGKAKKLDHPGHSAVYGPGGERLAFAGETAGVTVVEIDIGEVAKLRAAFPVLQDRKKPGATPLLTHRFYRPVDQAEVRT